MNSAALSGQEAYARLAAASQAHIETLPMETIMVRFQKLMRHQFAIMPEHRTALGDMLAARIQQGTDFHPSPETQKAMQAVFFEVVCGARDTLPEKQRQGMSTVLYTVHLLMILFWLIDRTEGNRATFMLVDFTTEAFSLLRPLLLMPLAGASLNRLAAILELVFDSNVSEQPGDA